MQFNFFYIYFDQLFFGFLFVLFGITLILKAIFKFNLPLWPLFGGITLIYAGLSLLTQTLNKSSYKNYFCICKNSK